MSKEIVQTTVNASVDVGKNIAQLLQQLADKIGTTVEQIFPWYVKQQVIEGTVFILVSSLAIILGMIMILLSYKKMNWKVDDGHELPNMTFVAGCIIAFVALCVLLINLPGDICKIMNPNYYALKALTSDMSKLIGK